MPRCANTSRSARGGCNGFLRSLVFRGRAGGGAADLAALAEASQDRAQAVSLVDVFRASRAKLGAAPAPRLHSAVPSAAGDDYFAGLALCESLHQSADAQG